MVEEEFPAFGFALFGVLLAELHGFFAVVVVFGYILYFSSASAAGLHRRQRIFCRRRLLPGTLYGKVSARLSG